MNCIPERSFDDVATGIAVPVVPLIGRSAGRALDSQLRGPRLQGTKSHSQQQVHSVAMESSRYRRKKKIVKIIKTIIITG